MAEDSQKKISDMAVGEIGFIFPRAIYILADSSIEYPGVYMNLSERVYENNETRGKVSITRTGPEKQDYSIDLFSYAPECIIGGSSASLTNGAVQLDLDRLAKIRGNDRKNQLLAHLELIWRERQDYKS